jgi:ectoine hydroxylase-related dioxygenase (phytanoyl-CoA dioxygenase family)
MASPSQSKTEEYLDQIEQKGYVEIPDIFPIEMIDKTNQIIERPFNTPTINGKRGYVQFGNARFLSSTLSWGREIIDLYTHPSVVALANAYTGDQVHLSNYRIYRTFPSETAKMAWHVDNKIDTYDYDQDQFVMHMVAQDKGLILIMYLTDIDEGGLQIVEESHKWTFEHEKESWDNQEAEFADKVVTFNHRPKGTAIFYDYRCIHRAQPYTSSKVRTSLFGQYSPSWMPTGEPILLNVRDLQGLSPEQQRVLNFGQSPTTENWPIGAPMEIMGALDSHSLSRISLKGLVKEKLRARLGKRTAPTSS